MILKKQKSNLLKVSSAIDNNKNGIALRFPAMMIAGVTRVNLSGRMLYLFIVPQTLVEFLLVCQASY